MIWSLFRRPATFATAPRQHLYTVAREKALLKAHRFGIRLKTSDILSVRGGDRPA